jgi:uncharacterized protein DUF6941
MAHVPLPVCKILCVCDSVATDVVDKRPSLLGLWQSKRVERFPHRIERFVVFALLCDSLGDVPLHVEVVRLDSNAVVFFTEPKTGHFGDRMKTVPVIFHIDNCVFPEAGAYVIRLLAFGDKFVGDFAIGLHQRGHE